MAVAQHERDRRDGLASRQQRPRAPGLSIEKMPQLTASFERFAENIGIALARICGAGVSAHDREDRDARPRSPCSAPTRAISAAVLRSAALDARALMVFDETDRRHHHQRDLRRGPLAGQRLRAGRAGARGGAARADGSGEPSCRRIHQGARNRAAGRLRSGGELRSRLREREHDLGREPAGPEGHAAVSAPISRSRRSPGRSGCWWSCRRRCRRRSPRCSRAGPIRARPSWIRTGRARWSRA